MNAVLQTAPTLSSPSLNAMSNNVLLTSKMNAYQQLILDQLNASWDSHKDIQNVIA